MGFKEIAKTHEISSSSIDSNNPTTSSSSSSSSFFSYDRRSRDRHCGDDERKRNLSTLSTDLRLGLSIYPSNDHYYQLYSITSISTSNHCTWNRLKDWPPIKPLLRSRLEEGRSSCGRVSLFVKVYMDGTPIGRKLDLLAHHGYNALVKALSFMFNTPILCPKEEDDHGDLERNINSEYVLTYEDEEGDWMMVGDVPWDMFLRNVKRLKITRADRCQGSE